MISRTRWPTILQLSFVNSLASIHVGFKVVNRFWIELGIMLLLLFTGIHLPNPRVRRSAQRLEKQLHFCDVRQIGITIWAINVEITCFRKPGISTEKFVKLFINVQHTFVRDYGKP